MTNIDQQLKDLRVRAGELVSAAESLATLFEEEGISLKRGDQVARLQVLYADIGKCMESARSDENRARSGYSEAKYFKLTAWSIAEVFGVEPIDVRWKKTSQKLAQTPVNGEPPFGMVLVCIGPGGLPEDVHVVSVSRMVRESCLKESEVIHSLSTGGNLLFDEKAFSRLIDRLAAEILKGGLSLPVSTERLSQLQAGRVLRITLINES